MTGSNLDNNPKSSSYTVDRSLYADYSAYVPQDATEELLRSYVVSFTEANHDGHAFSSEELQELRDIVRITTSEWSDKVLHRFTDELVCIAGFALSAYPKTSRSANIKRLTSTVLQPTNRLLRELKKQDFLRQTIPPVSPLKKDVIQTAVLALQELHHNVESHIDHLNILSKKGRAWDGWVKDIFVCRVHLLCSLLNPEFEAARKVVDGKEDLSQFREAVYMLARPIKWSEMAGSEVDFTGAIRTYVDNSNAGIKLLIQRAIEQQSLDGPAQD